MAQVYLVAVSGPAGFSKLLVVKKLRPNLVLHGDSVSLFLDEARLAARLHHPNIVQTNELERCGDDYVIAMEYLDGQPLAKLLERTKKKGGLPVHMVLRIVADACAGLHAAHELKDYQGRQLGVVHRDVSPQNIFVTYSGETKVVDFGIAKAASNSVETETGVLRGKVAYMSPEQAMGEALDRRADVFALGVVLYEALTRRRMWGKPDIEVLRDLLRGKVPTSPRDLDPNVPEDVDRICRRALAPNRDERYATALEMRQDIEACLTGLSIRSTARQLGELTARAFAKERAALDAVVDARMQTLGRTPSLPVVPLPAPPPRRARRVMWAFVLGVAFVGIALALTSGASPAAVASVVASGGAVEAGLAPLAPRDATVEAARAAGRRAPAHTAAPATRGKRGGNPLADRK